MDSPKLSFFVRLGSEYDTFRHRTRNKMLLGDGFFVDYNLYEVVGLGWEGDRFIVNLRALESAHSRPF